MFFRIRTVCLLLFLRYAWKLDGCSGFTKAQRKAAAREVRANILADARQRRLPPIEINAVVAVDLFKAAPPSLLGQHGVAIEVT